jgi:hypothetical protein
MTTMDERALWVPNDSATPDEPCVEPEWHLHSAAGAKGVTFRCDYFEDIDGALEEFKRAMLPVMCAWPCTVSQISITIA